MDLLAALAREEHRLLEPERPEHGAVERERPLEVATDEIDVAEADEHERYFDLKGVLLRGYASPDERNLPW